MLQVCRLEELAPGESRAVASEPPVVVFNVAGELFALEDQCSHMEFPLSDGYFDAEDASVECALHSGRFCVRTGDAICLPATKPVRTYPVTVENGEIYVDV